MPLTSRRALLVGPLLQCVVWHDGSHWRAAIDTSDMYEPDSDKGLLKDFKPLTNYKIERQYGTFSSEDGCNFVCNIYEEGKVLSIVVDSGSHGTHVAGCCCCCCCCCHSYSSVKLNSSVTFTVAVTVADASVTATLLSS